MRSVRGSNRGWALLNAKKRKSSTSNKKKPMPCYAKRQDRLNQVGFTAYKDYLESSQWQEIRRKKLYRFPHCVMCQENRSTEVHHMSYDVDTLMGKRDHRLVQLCRSCHSKIEFKPDGQKRHLKDANRVLIETALKTDRGKRWVEWMHHAEDIYKRNRRLTNRAKKKAAKQSSK